MKKFFTLLLAVFCISAFAEPVSESEARKTALLLLKSKLGNTQLKSGKKLTSENLTLVENLKDGNTSLYYVYNAENDGFVIVSGVEEAPAILAYGLNGGVDMDNMSNGMKALLKSYAAVMKKVAADPSIYKTMADTEKKEDIEHMIKTKWAQDVPYNNLLKFKKYSSEDSVVCVTGCPATATAMMMKYYHDKNGWFKGSKSIPDYISYPDKPKGDTLIVDSLPEVTFDWEHCDDTYGEYGNDSKSDLAVAQVMRYCGQAMSITYGKDESSNNSNDEVLGINKYLVGDDNFQAVLFERYSCTDKEWQELIYHELSNGRPVNITGEGPNGGHSFICDGYQQRDNGDYYHINWGWSGQDDGYFRYDSLVAEPRNNYCFSNDLITYVTDEEKAEIENLGITTPDFLLYTTDSLWFYDATKKEHPNPLPIQYKYEGNKIDNYAYIETYIYAVLQESLKFTPYVEVTNTSNNASIIIKAPDPYNEPPIDIDYNNQNVRFVLNLKELKSKMVKNDLGTTDIYKLLLKTSDDSDKKDYLVPKYYWYYFRFNETADSIEFLSPIKIDELVVGDGGDSTSAFHFTVTPEFQGQELSIGVKVYDKEGGVVAFMEGQIEETDTEGYLNTYDCPIDRIKGSKGKKKYYVCLYNGMYLGSNSDITAIEEIASESNTQQKSGKRYNLAGQEVDDNYKGIVILNGKKIIEND